ncbi:hypothetical protein SELMODRAFT_415947 [Selaginella moellendorffii]|uniref:Uncharacterized protein n=1 Tax=Selaginella moellendorffii TaxID=88036 RepID=D8RXL8_SELML|nr:hypothetical protein SELMODRAFT_415947 [Selaginella moellendorffii]
MEKPIENNRPNRDCLLHKSNMKVVMKLLCREYVGEEDIAQGAISQSLKKPSGEAAGKFTFTDAQSLKSSEAPTGWPRTSLETVKLLKGVRNVSLLLQSADAVATDSGPIGKTKNKGYQSMNNGVLMEESVVPAREFILGSKLISWICGF